MLILTILICGTESKCNAIQFLPLWAVPTSVQTNMIILWGGLKSMGTLTYLPTTTQNYIWRSARHPAVELGLTLYTFTDLTLRVIIPSQQEVTLSHF